MGILDLLVRQVRLVQLVYKGIWVLVEIPVLLELPDLLGLQEQLDLQVKEE
jgi:hypothetical protein